MSDNYMLEMGKSPATQAQKFHKQGRKDAMNGEFDPPDKDDCTIAEWSGYLNGHDEGKELKKTS